LTRKEIQEYVRDYQHAAKCALEAGFDGVEVHGAHGYLPDQFLQKSCNNRSDSYGGSIENRSRFILEILDAVSSVVGDDRMAIRLSPFSEFQGMGLEDDPYETWGYLIKTILNEHPKLAYISLTDPRLQGQSGSSAFGKKVYSNDYFRALVRGVDLPKSNFQVDSTTVFPDPDLANPTLVLAAGGFLPSDAEPQSVSWG
jgi:NADPH2 dehydrogenase